MAPFQKDGPNTWRTPVPGMEFDVEGPSADHLIDTSEIYDQVVYRHVLTNNDEWELLNERYADQPLYHCHFYSN